MTRRSLSRRVGLLALAALMAGLTFTGLTTQPAAAETDGGGIVPVTNWRLFATTSTTPMYSGQIKTLQVTGNGGIPSTGVSAVVVDVAASSTNSAYVTVAPSGSGQTASVLSVRENAGWDSNTAIVRVSSDGKVDLSVNVGATQVILDIQGYVTSDTSTEDGGFVAVPQARIARSDTGQGFSSTYRLTGGYNYPVDVAGVGGVPADASAVYANVRVWYSSGPGALRVGPSNQSASSISALNYQTTAAYDSAALIRLGTDGKIRLFGDSGTSFHVSIDVQGYVTPGGDGAGLTPIVPQYILNQTQLQGGETREVQVTGVGGIPDFDAVGAVMLNFMATTWTTGAALSLANADDPPSNVYQLSLSGTSTGTGQRTTVIAQVSADGTVNITNHGTTPVGVAITALGWFAPTPSQIEERAADADAEPTAQVPETPMPPSVESVSSGLRLSTRAIDPNGDPLSAQFTITAADGQIAFQGASPVQSVAGDDEPMAVTLPMLPDGAYEASASSTDGTHTSTEPSEGTKFVVENGSSRVQGEPIGPNPVIRAIETASELTNDLLLTLPIDTTYTLRDDENSVILSMDGSDIGKYEVTAVDADGNPVTTTLGTDGTHLVVGLLPASEATYPIAVVPVFTSNDPESAESEDLYESTESTEFDELAVTDIETGMEELVSDLEEGSIPVSAAASSSTPSYVKVPKKRTSSGKIVKQKYYYYDDDADDPKRQPWPEQWHDYCTSSRDTYNGASFKGPCARHDLCIEFKQAPDRSYCDPRLKADMRTNCRHEFEKWWEYDLKIQCYGRASAYYAAVKRTTESKTDSGHWGHSGKSSWPTYRYDTW